jgi:hypothetical protein
MKWRVKNAVDTCGFFVGRVRVLHNNREQLFGGWWKNW